MPASDVTISTTSKAPIHSFGSWKLDKNNHWKECMTCQQKGEEAKHSFIWIIDQEATDTQNGLKHQ